MSKPLRCDAPPDFMLALYGEDEDSESEGQEDEVTKEFFEDCSDEEEDPVGRDASSPTAPPYSPRTSSKRRRHTLQSSQPCINLGQVSPRNRSRSPLIKSEPCINLGQVSPRNRSRSPLIKSEPSDGIVGMPPPLHNVFIDQDSHALYESVKRVSEGSTGLTVKRIAINDGKTGFNRGRRVRGRVRSGRERRVRSHGHGQSRGLGTGRRRRQASIWQPGQPLEEIWLTDKDFPLELREMELGNVIRSRQAKLDKMEARRSSCERPGLDEGKKREGENDDVFEDASDGRGNLLLEGEDHHFEWSPMETFRGVEETFIPERTGSVSSYTNPYDAFRSYWDDGILQTIVEETNQYASRISSAAFQSNWYPTNADELLCLFAFWMMTGIIRMPTICSYFSNNSLLKTEVFSRITTLKRYTILNRALHFVDTSLASDSNPTNNDNASFDRLHRLRPVIDHLNSKFKSNYVMSKDICIDESLTLWKGSLKFKQYIRSKAAKFGIKTFELCESATGYLWSFIVYTGKHSSSDPELAKSTAVVRKLVEPLLNKGYRLFMDNWFNSPYLARFLKRNGTDCVGTLRASRVDVPRLVTHAPLKQGQLVARHSGDVCVLSWMDKMRINVISTCHGSATALPIVSSHPPARPELFKPQSILDYNRSMGGVDLKDQMLEPYLLERKRCAKWYIKLFKRLLNCSIHNSRVLLESSLKVRQDNLKFRLELVHAILNHHHSRIPKNRRAESSHNRAAPFPHVVNSTHWPVRLPQTDKDQARNRQSRLKCVVCLQEGRKMQRTTYKCETCNVPLCVEECFKKYHTSSFCR